MRHFNKSNIPQRYDKYRPKVHAEIIKLCSRSIKRKLKHVADIACGTGHSLAPLIGIADNVSATDISSEMLSVAKSNYPQVNFYHSSAETLPFSDNSLDGIFVGMAFHWFDQLPFLNEAVRTLLDGGYLFIYNMSFPGIMLNTPEYNYWHANTYWHKFPNPVRNPTSPDAVLIKNSELRLVDQFAFNLEVDFTCIELRNYLCTQSNIDAAIDEGHNLEQIQSWLDDELKCLFRSNNSAETFIYSATGVLAQKCP